MTIRSDIQILRGVSVLLVIFYHLQIDWFRNGFLGVDVFFVISGYLMARLYGGRGWRDFYARRVRRLLPGASVALALTLVVASQILLPIEFQQTSEQVRFGLLFLTNIYYWNSDSYFDADEFRPLLHFWSLAVEMQVYLALPLLFFVFRKVPGSLLAAISLSAGLCLLVGYFSTKTAFFITPFRLWEFLAGVLATRVEDRLGAWQRRVSVSLFGLLLMSGTVFAWPIEPGASGVAYGHPAAAALVTCAATVTFLIAGMPAGFCASWLGKSLARIGDYSYSLYLYHFPVIVFVNYVPFRASRLGFETFADLVCIVAVTAILSIISYHTVERGQYFFRNRVVLCSGTLLLIFVGGPVLQRVNESGFSMEQQRIFAGWRDRYVNRCGKAFRLLNPGERICKLASGNEDHTILLVGNSHADAIKTAFSETAEGKASLLFYTEVDVLFGSIGPQEILSDVRDRRVTSIVLHFSNLYDNEARRKKIVQLLTLLEEETVKIYVLAPVPTYDRSILENLFLDTIEPGRRTTQGVCDHYEKTAAFQNFARRLEALGAQIYDPAPYLCGSGGCRMQGEAGDPFYFDAMHLTNAGARELAPIFEAIVVGPPVQRSVEPAASACGPLGYSERDASSKVR